MNDKGTRVRVRTVSGEAVLVVAGESRYGGMMFCSEDEFARAAREQREPEGVGWPPEDILEVLDVEESSR